MSSSIKLSRLGFGCASVMGKVDRRTSLNAMALAYDLGVTHFDIARSYGFGRAEAVLGAFAASKRDRITITTKFGVVPPQLSWKHKFAMPIARNVAKYLPGLQKRLKAKSGTMLADQCFDVAYAKQCLHQSLTELKTDYIDIYLLHEPPLLSEDTQWALYEFLDQQVKAGVLRSWGHAYKTPTDMINMMKGNSSIQQVEGNASTFHEYRSAQLDQRQKIVTRPFAGGQSVMSTSPQVALGLAMALAGPEGCVVCSMFNPTHIQQNVQMMKNTLADPRHIQHYEEILRRSWSA